jgi:hypothetical protein
MRKFASTILLLGCFSFLMQASVTGQRQKEATVVAKFGGECQRASFNPSPELEQLIQKIKHQQDSPCDSPFCDGAFAYDLNGDGREEFFVRFECGATGNCTWGIFSDRPARLRGIIPAWLFYIHKRAGSWSTITSYIRVTGDQGVIATFANRRGRYTQTSERIEYGYYGNPQPFLNRMGVPKCDDSRAAQPNNSLNRSGISLPFIRQLECLIQYFPPG